MSMTTGITAERNIEMVLAYETDLRAAGIRRMLLFGSAADGEFGPESNVELAVEFDPAACARLFCRVALGPKIGELLGGPVQLLPEPVEKRRLHASADRDRRRVF